MTGNQHQLWSIYLNYYMKNQSKSYPEANELSYLHVANLSNEQCDNERTAIEVLLSGFAPPTDQSGGNKTSGSSFKLFKEMVKKGTDEEVAFYNCKDLNDFECDNVFKVVASGININNINDENEVKEVEKEQKGGAKKRGSVKKSSKTTKKSSKTTKKTSKKGSKNLLGGAKKSSKKVSKKVSKKLSKTKTKKSSKKSSKKSKKM